MVVLGERSDRIDNRLGHVRSDQLLPLLLNEIIAVVLRHFPVDASRQADDTLLPRVAHINTDQHGALLGDSFGEGDAIDVTTSFAVDLAQDVAGSGQIEFTCILEGYALGWQLELEADFLEHRVVRLVGKQGHHDDGLSEGLTIGHVVLELVLEVLSHVGLLAQGDPEGILHFETELARGFGQHLGNFIR